nr:NADH dehydrogenase subunit 5 [Seira dowlingi]
MLNKIKYISFYLGFMLLLFSMMLFYEGWHFFFNLKVVFIEWEIFEFISSSIIMTLLIDWMSLTFSAFVLMISGLVLMYSSSYMSVENLFFGRFIWLVYLFVLSMIFLVFSPNLISILLGWDGLGLVSYCLVIYYQNVKSANAGMLTILSNRIGDVAILLGIAWMLNYGSWNFFFLQMMYMKSDMLLIIIMVFLAALTKSAQIPFSAWLPAAMAAPTPVSALVHSSTLVTAGVYLLIRFSYILGESFILLYIGMFTMFMSGLGANFEMDLKKIIALSTLSQLGMMMIALSLGSLELAFFHLLSHALFKSLLFLCAGVYIHGMKDTQDIRYLMGVYISCPISSFFFVGCSLSLCGFPFLSGFYSKDMILEYYFMGEMNLLMLLMIFVGTLLTALYSIRVSFFIYMGGLGSFSTLGLSEDEGMFYPMSFLFIVSVLGGGFMVWLYFPEFSVLLSNVWKISILLSLIILFIYSFKMILQMNFLAAKPVNYWVYFFGSMWFLPNLSTTVFMKLLSIGSFLLNRLDQGWVEFFGGQGFFNVASKLSSRLDFSIFFMMKSFMFMTLLSFIFIVSYI